MSIQSVTPSGDVGLISGDRVKFVVTARANGITKPSLIALVVQSESATLGLTEPAPIENGKVVTMELVTTVPNGSTLRLFTPVYEAGANETGVLDTRVFKIIGKRASSS